MTSLPATERYPSLQNRTFLPTSHLFTSLPPKQSKKMLLALTLFQHLTWGHTIFSSNWFFSAIPPPQGPSTQFHQVDNRGGGTSWAFIGQDLPGERSSKTFSPSASLSTIGHRRWSKLWMWNYNPPSESHKVILSFTLMAKWDGMNKDVWLLPLKVPSVSAREPGWETTLEFTGQTPD